MMISTAWESDQSAGTRSGMPPAPFLSVVGFDGTAHAVRALDDAVRQLRGREGSIELVYVAEPPANTSEISRQARTHLVVGESRWHFQHRDGKDVPEELIAAADELRQNHGQDANIAIVVGSSTEHRSRVVLALVQRHRYPVLVVP